MSALPKPGSSIRERIEQLSLVPLLDDPKITALSAAHANSRREHDKTALRDDLAAVAAKTGQRIVIPNRPFTLGEWQTIRMLRSILRTGSVTRTWTKLVVRMVPADIRGVDTTSAMRDASLAIGPIGDDPIELFGTRLSLGLRNLFFRQAILGNAAEAHEQLAVAQNAQAHIQLHFVPGPDASLQISYPDWDTKNTGNRLDAAERPLLLAIDDSKRLNQLLDRQAHDDRSQGERAELDALLDEHGARLRDRAIGLFAVQHGIDSAEARQIIDADLADALAWWSAFQSDPARMEAAIEEAQRHRSQHGG